MTAPDPVLARCDGNEEADRALAALVASGEDPRRLSVIGRLSGGRADGARDLGSALWSRLAGAFVFALPRVGLVTCAGPIASEMTRILDEGRGDDALNLFEQALVHLGCEGPQAMAHGAALGAGRTLVLHHGSCIDAERGRSVLAGLARPGPRTAAIVHQGA